MFELKVPAVELIMAVKTKSLGVMVEEGGSEMCVSPAKTDFAHFMGCQAF